MLMSCDDALHYMASEVCWPSWEWRGVLQNGALADKAAGTMLRTASGAYMKVQISGVNGTQ
jgi:hypothetical protein